MIWRVVVIILGLACLAPSCDEERLCPRDTHFVGWDESGDVPMPICEPDSPPDPSSPDPTPEPVAPEPSPSSAPTPAPEPSPTDTPGPTPEPEPAPSPTPCVPSEVCTADGITGSFPDHVSACKARMGALVRNGYAEVCGEWWYWKKRGWIDEHCNRWSSPGGSLLNPWEDGWTGIECSTVSCPPDPGPTPDVCPPARQGLSSHLRPTANPDKFVADTTTHFGCNGRPCPCNDNEGFAACGGRRCEPADSGPDRLRLQIVCSDGVECGQEGANAYFVEMRVPSGTREWTVRVCLAPGNVAEAGDVLRLLPNPCKEQTYRRP